MCEYGDGEDTRSWRKEWAGLEEGWSTLVLSSPPDLVSGVRSEQRSLRDDHPSPQPGLRTSLPASVCAGLCGLHILGSNLQSLVWWQ